MRIDNWENELANYLEVSRSINFEWGVNDCCLWVAKFADKITGSNIAQSWFRLYATEEEANTLMLERGFASIDELVDSFCERIPIKQAKRGDIIMHPCGALGICDGRRSYFLDKDKGLTVMLTMQSKIAWRL